MKKSNINNNISYFTILFLWIMLNPALHINKAFYFNIFYFFKLSSPFFIILIINYIPLDHSTILKSTYLHKDSHSSQ